MKTYLLLCLPLLLLSCSSDDSSSCSCDAKFQYSDYDDEIYTIEENTPIDCVTGEFSGEQGSGPFQPIFIECVD